MNHTLIAVTAFSLAFPIAGLAQSTMQAASATAPLSPREMHILIKSAHSKAEYTRLAQFFTQQEARYRAEAAAEKIERDRRAQVNAALMQKYPRPVDSAQYLYESYIADADNAAIRARHYDQLAVDQDQHDQQLATASPGKS